MHEARPSSSASCVRAADIDARKEEEKREQSKVTIEEVKDDEEEDDEDDDEDEEDEKEEDDDKDDDKEDGTAGNRKGKQSRSEKKARRAMAKLGLKPMAGISRVTLRQSKNTMFAISEPDVFKSPASDTYIIFGEIQDLSSQAQSQAAEQFKVPEPAAEGAAGPSAKVAEVEAEAEEEEEGEVDATGVEEKDIELVMTQAGVSRGRAVSALKSTEGDIVDAIMKLTT